MVKGTAALLFTVSCVSVSPWTLHSGIAHARARRYADVPVHHFLLLGFNAAPLDPSAGLGHAHAVADHEVLLALARGALPVAWLSASFPTTER